MKKKSLKIRQKRFSSGQILILSLIFVLIIMALSGVLVSLVYVYYQNGVLAYNQEKALQLAEAGIDKALYLINQSGGGSYAGETNTALGGGVFTLTVTNVGSRKIIESTGYIPDSTNPQASRKVRVELRQTTAGASFIYGVQVGYGGLKMHNNAQITGSVYSNGTAEGQVNTQITGDAWVAGGVSPAPDQQQTIQTGEQNVGDIEEREDAAQSFRPSVTLPISRVSLLIRKVSNPSDATVHIVADNSGSPGSTSLASGNLNSASVGTSFGWIDVSMTTNPQLTAGQSYWIVIDVPAPRATRYYVWAKHDNSGYGNGVGKHSGDWAALPAVWVDSGGDFGFKTWMGSGATKLTSMTVGTDAHANTIENSTIGRDAYYQTIINSTVVRFSFPGSADPPTLDMPISDAVVEDFKNGAEAGGTIVPPGGEHVLDGVIADLGPVKIQGNLRIDNNAVVTLKGPVWVEGDIRITNNAILQLDPGFGSDSSMMIADYPADPFSKGKIIVNNNAQVNGSGDPSSYIMLLSTFAHPTNLAIDIGNNVLGAIFYSSDGITQVTNNVSVKEVIAYRLVLNNNATVVYEQGLANVNFSSGPSGGWILKKGSWQMVLP